MPGCVKCEQSGLCEEGVGPAFVIVQTESEAGPLLLLAQDGAQPSADKAVYKREGAAMCVLEVAEPASAASD